MQLLFIFTTHFLSLLYRTISFVNHSFFGTEGLEEEFYIIFTPHPVWKTCEAKFIGVGIKSIYIL